MVGCCSSLDGMDGEDIGADGADGKNSDDSAEDALSCPAVSAAFALRLSTLDWIPCPIEARALPMPSFAFRAGRGPMPLMMAAARARLRATLCGVSPFPVSKMKESAILNPHQSERLAVIDALEAVLALLDGGRLHLLHLRSHQADMLRRSGRLVLVVEGPDAHFALDIAMALLVLLRLVVREADKAPSKRAEAREETAKPRLLLLPCGKLLLIVLIDKPAHIGRGDGGHGGVDEIRLRDLRAGQKGHNFVDWLISARKSLLVSLRAPL